MTNEELKSFCQDVLLQYARESVKDDHDALVVDAAQSCLGLLDQLRVAEEALEDAAQFHDPYREYERYLWLPLERIRALRAGQERGGDE